MSAASISMKLHPSSVIQYSTPARKSSVSFPIYILYACQAVQMLFGSEILLLFIIFLNVENIDFNLISLQVVVSKTHLTDQEIRSPMILALTCKP